MTVEPFRNQPVETFATPEAQAAMRHALREVRARFGGHYPLIIGGARVDTPRRLVSTNPSNPSEVVGTTAQAGAAEAEAALEAAWKAFPSWSALSQEARSRALLKAAAILKERRREFEAWMVYEIGKNWVEASADVAEAIDFLEYYARQAIRYAAGAPVYPYPNEDNESIYLPLGAGVVIAPWNFPLAILTGMTAGPLAVGNTVVVKPAEDTVVLAAKLFEVLEAAGLPPGVANFLPGLGEEVGAYLVAHPRTRFINFTGSLEVGLKIGEAAARLAPGQRWIKRVFLELGGKDAIIVDESADLAAAAAGIIQSAYGFQGQKCSACSRLIVVEPVYEPLMEQLLERASRLTVGPAEENPDLGPLASAQQAETVGSYLKVGQEEARLRLGGERLEGAGFFFPPTIFDRVDPEARIAQEEIFGPVLSVITVPDFNTALEVANGTRYGLTGGVYSRNRDHLEKARREFHVGNLYLNRKITGALVGVQPFGGFNLSGTDTKAGGPDYLLNFLQMKSITERW
jgi:1-pyrroline-5-carboxylate dehydrogenase